jgi:hypothetical protein
MPTNWKSVAREFALVWFLLFLADRAVAAWLLPLFAPDRVTATRPGTLRSSTAYGNLRAMVHVTPDVLILGSSRALSNYNDALLSERSGRAVYNGGCDGSGLLQARAAFAVASARRHISVVVLDLVFLPRENAQIRRLEPWMGTHPVIDDLLQPRDWRDRCKSWSAAYRCGGSLAELVQDYGKLPRPHGYLPRIAAWTAAGPPQLLERPNGLQLPPWYWENLEKFAGEVHAAGSRLILVESPTWVRERADIPGLAVQPHVEWAAQRKIAFWRLGLNELPRLRSASYFADPLHLNDYGAQVFGTELAVRLSSLDFPRAAPLREAGR